MDRSDRPPPAPFTLIQGGNALDDVDWTYLLEELDLRDALPLLLQLGRRKKPAANSPLHLVDEDQPPD